MPLIKQRGEPVVLPQRGPIGLTGASGEELNYATKAYAETQNISSGAVFVRTAGHNEVGKGGAVWRKRNTTPSHPAYWTDADGKIFSLAEELPNIFMFGAVGDGTTNDQDAFDAADAYGRAVYVPDFEFLVTTVPTGLYYGPGIVQVDGEDDPIELPETPNRIDAVLSGEDPRRLQNLVIGGGAGASALAGESRASVVLGWHAGYETQEIDRTVLIGMEAGAGIINSYGQTVVGSSAMARSAYSDRNTCLGSNAGKWGGSADPVADLHDFFRPGLDGWETNMNDLLSRNPAVQTDYIGPWEGPSLVVATEAKHFSRNIAIGRDCLIHAVKAKNNIAIGYTALRNGWDCADNVAVGYEALGDGLKAYRCVAIGRNAAWNTQDAEYVVAVGHAALGENVFCSDHIAIGAFAANCLGQGITDKSDARDLSVSCIAIGRDALRFHKQGINNIAIGTGALYGAYHEIPGDGDDPETDEIEDTIKIADSTGNQNVAIGGGAMGVNTSGSENVAIGKDALGNNTTGGTNTALGRGALLTLRLSGLPQQTISNATGVGYQARVAGANELRLGNNSVTVTCESAISVTSDGRDKRDIRDTVLGLDFLLRHRPVEYRLDSRSSYVDFADDGSPIVSTPDGSRAGTRFHEGFIAQEVDAIRADMGVDFAGLKHSAHNGGEDVWGIAYEEYIPVLVKAIQEQQAQIEALKAEVAELRAA